MAIIFTDGLWHTHFDTADWTQDAALDCDGIEMADDSAWAAGTVGSQIISAANMTGSVGKGWRTYFTADTHNVMSTPMRVTFAATTQLWVRFYYRLPSGQYFGGTPAHKIIYLYGPSNGFRVDWIRYEDKIGIESGSIDYTYPDRGYSNVALGNWASLYGGGPTTTPADGSWHCFEFYFNVGTTTSNGIFRFWLDGVNVINDTAANLGAGATLTYFDIPHNHNSFMYPSSGNNAAHDIDEVAVAISTYTGFVQNTTGYATGLNMIGPLDFEEGSASKSPSASPSVSPSASPSSLPGTTLLSETFDSRDMTGQGWIDETWTSPTAFATGRSGTGYCAKFTWAISGQTPAGVGTIRKAITATEQMFISCYWRFNTDWVGSGTYYHPHVIYVLSDRDYNVSPFWGPSQAYLDTYLEPHALGLWTENQDSLNIGTTYGDCNGCQSPYSGQDEGDTDSCGGGYNERVWHSTASFSPLVWYHIEMWCKMNTMSGATPNADGEMKVWVDGVSVLNLTHVVYRNGENPTLKWRQFIIAPYIGDGSPQAQTMWMDDLVVTDANPYEESTSSSSLSPSLSPSISPSTSPSISPSVSQSPSKSPSASPSTGAHFILAPSANIAAGGGTVTTNQLTAPTGKTEYTQGRIVDDSPTTQSIDIGDGHWTELEWCIQSTEHIEPGATYEFRVKVEQ